MRPSLLFLLFPVVPALQYRTNHYHVRRVPQGPISTSQSLSLTLTSVYLSSSSTTTTTTTTSVSSSADVPTTSTTFNPAPTSSQPSSLADSSATPSSSSSSSSSPSTVSTSVSSASSASSAPLTAVQSQQTSSSAPTTSSDDAGASFQGFSSTFVFSTSTVATPSSTSSHSSSSGFFANTGAVAGTFTVVGLCAIAAAIAIILLIARRRHSHNYEEDTEYLDKPTDPSLHPPITHVTSVDDGSSDHAHYGATPMTVASPPTAYYTDHAYPPQPQAFSPDVYQASPRHAYPAQPVASTQDYPPQRMYFPDDYDIAYPPPASRVGANASNPHGFTDVQLASAPVTQTRTALPSALRPSAGPTPSAPKQWSNTRFSIDSFYAGIANDTPPSHGNAL